MASTDKPTETGTKRGASRHHARRWIPYAGALVLVGLIIAGLWPQPVPVETAQATVGTLRTTVNEEGKTRIKQRFLVSTPVTGQLRRIPFKAGAEVTAGQTVLAVIEPLAPTPLDARARTLAEARRDSALANLEKARAAGSFAASELRRFEKLFAEKTVSTQELEAIQLRESAAAKDTTAAEAMLRQAEAELAAFAAATASNSPPQEIKAPTSGKVLRVLEESARPVTAGTPLVEVGDPADIEVVIEVLSRDGAAIETGMRVEFEQSGASKAPKLLGHVRLVEPAAFTKVSALGVEEQRVRVIADLDTPPQERMSIGDNFRVEARVIVWEASDALKVPAGTLFRQGNQWAAFALLEGRSQLRLIEVGRSSGAETQVLKGLEKGQEVILYPGSRVRDGQRVKPIKI
jgi:HlyD family secretion protein